MPDRDGVDNAVEQADALASVVEAARDDHDARCGCTGEACKLGAALALLTVVEAVSAE